MTVLLHSARLILRNIQDSDLEPFLAYRNIPEVARYQGWDIPFTREQAEQFILSMKDLEAPKAGHWMQLAIELKESGEMIGDVACRIRPDDAQQAVIGFTIAPGHWRRGYAVEAVLCLVGFLFDDLGLHRVSADCDVENTGSWRTLEKAGFRREAHFQESYMFRGAYTSEYYYGLLQREWQAGGR